jgi:hypothetical protein
MNMGRPSTFTDEIFDEICERLANGQTLSQICRDPEMPSREAVTRWTKNDDGRRKKYDLARQDGMDALADTIVDIACVLYGNVPLYARASARRGESTLS